MNSKIIAVDFDGTLCENKWPEIGEANEDLILYLRNLQSTGMKIVLWTCRVGERLNEAIRWCHAQGLVFDAVNENVPEVLQWMGGDSRKIYADVYIDDKMGMNFNLPYSTIKIPKIAIDKFQQSMGMQIKIGGTEEDGES